MLEDLARYSGVPVWNGLTDQFHPTQMLADIMTAREEFGDMRGRKLTFFGDARNNVANSLLWETTSESARGMEVAYYVSARRGS